MALTLSAQEKKGSVKGRVINATTNEGVPFSTVVIFGTTTGAMTDFDGNFLFTGIEQSELAIFFFRDPFNALVRSNIDPIALVIPVRAFCNMC